MNALRLQKELIRYWEDHSVAEAVEQGIVSFAAAWESDEPRRLMRSFLEAKRGRRGATTS